jgi:hypothetical protein
MWGSIRVSEGLSELLFFGGIAYLVYMYFTKRNYFPYSGYYSVGLTEEQIDGFKGKNALLNAQYELKKAQWYSELIRDNDVTSPHYRAVREKADRLDEKAKSLLEELGEDNARVKAAQDKAEAMNKKAEKLYANFNLNGKLKLAEDDAVKAEEAYNKLKEEDPDSANTLAAQEKAETASLLVEKIRDNIDQDQKMRDDMLEKEQLHIEALEEKVQLIEEELANKVGTERKSEEQAQDGKDKDAKAEEPDDKEKDTKVKDEVRKEKPDKELPKKTELDKSKKTKK